VPGILGGGEGVYVVLERSQAIGRALVEGSPDQGPIDPVHREDEAVEPGREAGVVGIWSFPRIESRKGRKRRAGHLPFIIAKSARDRLGP
jgi:hypothetical protein